MLFIAATAEVASSGKEVPNATMLAATAISFTPNIDDMLTAPLTTASAPMAMPAIPMERIRRASMKAYSACFFPFHSLSFQ